MAGTRRNDPEVHAKRLKALELRRAGHSYLAIAAQVGYSEQGAAFKAVSEALKATLREPADEVRRLELERLDRLTLAHWPAAESGNLDSLDRILKLMKRRAELLGLDAPKTLRTEDVTQPTSEVEERIVTTRTQADEALRAMEEAGSVP